MTAPLTADEALEIARFCWPGPETWTVWEDVGYPTRPAHARPNRFDHRSPLLVHAAERALVERGLGDRYGLALSEELGSPHGPAGCSYDAVAKIRTAPLPVVARAILETVREAQQ